MSATESAPEPQTGKLARVISANVKELMTQRGVSQHQLAAALGMPQTSIGKRLRGATHWTADDIEAVALAFEVEVIDLLRPTEDVPARPLRPVVRDLPHRRRSGVVAGRPDQRGGVNGRYLAAIIHRPERRSSRDDWRIRELRGSHELPILARRHGHNLRICQKVAA